VSVACAAALASSAHAPRARAAGPAEEAEALITKGIELRERGKDDEALVVFKKALATSASPRARAQVALAEQALGLWVAAEADLAQALATEADPWITKNRAALEGALAIVRRHLGSLEVRGTPEGAEVVLDGVALGKLPASAPFRVEAGHRNLEVRATGYHATARTVEVPAGGVARETVALVALPADGRGAGGAGLAPGAGGGDGAGAAAAEHDPGRTQRLLGWTLAGTGGALAITGAVGMLVRKGIVDDYNVQCPGLGAAQQPADCDQKIDSARTWLTVSIVSFVAGGVLMAGGLTLALTAPRAPAKTAASIGCAPSGMGAGGGGLACAGSF